MATRVGLTKAIVLQAATELADTVGLEGLTLHLLAERLGVRAPTLYHYLPDGIVGLQRELALWSMREQADLLGKVIMGKSGTEALWALAETYRAYIKAHHGLYAATTMLPPRWNDTELLAAHQAVFEIAMRAVAAYHFSEDDAVHAVRMLRIIVHGAATLELAGGFGLPQATDETFRRLFTIYLDALDTLAAK
jgi:AcrR family transcriptional regulator